MINSTSHVVDWYGSFQLTQNRSLVTSLKAIYIGCYSSTVRQLVYIYNWAKNVWELQSTSRVGTSLTTITINLENHVQDYIANNSTVSIRIYAVKASSFTCYANLLKLEVFYMDQSAVTICFTNLGKNTVHLVSLWIIDASGRHNFNSTSTPSFDIYIPASHEETVSINYTWSTDIVEIKVFTEPGSVATKFYTT